MKIAETEMVPITELDKTDNCVSREPAATTNQCCRLRQLRILQELEFPALAWI